MEQVVWISVDPVRRKVDFYPKAIAERIESYYNTRDPWAHSTCILGSEFFNATVHFHPSGRCYQTTPGMSMGRAGFKPAGYRSVKRNIIEPGVDHVVVFGKQVYGEWRIASEADSEIRFDESLPLDVCIDGSDDIGETLAFRPWNSADLSSGAWDVPVVVWQWCRGALCTLRCHLAHRSQKFLHLHTQVCLNGRAAWWRLVTSGGSRTS